MKLGFLLFIFVFILAACSSPSGSDYSEQNQVEIDPPEQSLNLTVQEEINPEENEAQQESLLSPQAQTSLASQLQSFFIDSDQVNIIDSRQVEWSDSCLGIDRPGAECISEVTQGYMITLEANGLQFEYRADQDGGQVVPATLGLIWTREGGENQNCDRLIIFLPDIAHTCWCQSGEMLNATVNLQKILSIEEYEHLVDSLRKFTENTVKQPLTGESEPAMVALTFHGQGKTIPQSNEQQSLLALAETIFTRTLP